MRSDGAVVVAVALVGALWLALALAGLHLGATVSEGLRLLGAQ